MDYDVLILGTGSAASKVAHAASDDGLNTAVVDSAPIGGTCALRGCMPKKVYVAAAETLDWAGRLDDHGVHADTDVDWQAVQDFKTRFTDGFNDGITASYEDAGVDLLKGRASFQGPHTVEVNNDAYTADNIVIATGNKPRPLTFPGSDHLVTSDEFLSLDDMPDSLVFVGGGYISFEFAHVAARTGADVTILQRDDTPLPMFEASIVDELLDASRDAGIDVKLNTAASSIEHNGDQYVVYDDGEHVCQADLAVHGAGRVPQINDLNLDNAGIDAGPHGVHVKDTLQSTSQSHVYAAGDCAASPGLPLTPIATIEGEAVAANLLGDDVIPDYTGTATTLFSIPPVAGVGMQEAQVREKGYDYTVNEGDSGEWFSSQRLGLTHGRYKVLVDDATDEVLGAHLIGHNADEVINIFAAAIRHGITAEELKATPWSYPTSIADTDYML